MTERIRSLLDSAVADVQPRVADPVPVIVRRGRAQRRHAVVAGATALTTVVAVATIGVAALGHGGDDRPLRPDASSADTPTPSPSVSAPSPSAPEPSPPPSSTPPSSSPPLQRGPDEPAVIDGQIRVRGLSLPAPEGWRVIKRGERYSCDRSRPGGSVLLGDIPPPTMDQRCPNWTDLAVFSWHPSESSDPVREFRLPGGQPGWTYWRDPLGNNPEIYYREPPKWAAYIHLPWAGALVYVSGPQLATVQSIFASIRTVPVSPSRLVLPTGKTSARLDLPGEYSPIEVGDPAALGRILDRLRRLTDVVPDNRACVSDRQMAMVTFGWSGGTPPMSIAISTGGCSQATSSLGGRVRVPAGLVAELRELFVQGRGW